MSDPDKISAAAIREVIERHDAFVLWFSGTAEDGLFDEIERALGPDMVMVDPSGALIRRPALVAGLRAGFGSRPSFIITVDEPETLWATADAALVAYIERQDIAGVTSARRSTALFTTDEHAPLGVVWQHVHETWIERPKERA